MSPVTSGEIKTLTLRTVPSLDTSADHEAERTNPNRGGARRLLARRRSSLTAGRSQANAIALGRLLYKAPPPCVCLAHECESRGADGPSLPVSISGSAPHSPLFVEPWPVSGPGPRHWPRPTPKTLNSIRLSMILTRIDACEVGPAARLRSRPATTADRGPRVQTAVAVAAARIST